MQAFESSFGPAKMSDASMFNVVKKSTLFDASAKYRSLICKKVCVRATYIPYSTDDGCRFPNSRTNSSTFCRQVNNTGTQFRAYSNSTMRQVQGTLSYLKEGKRHYCPNWAYLSFSYYFRTSYISFKTRS
jgi:hypothetical protein